MDSRFVASAAVKKNLGPDPSMGRKVELLRRLVSMRQERKPVATGQPVKRPGVPSGRPRGGRPSWEGVPRPGGPLRPAQFSHLPGYKFGPPGA